MIALRREMLREVLRFAKMDVRLKSVERAPYDPSDESFISADSKTIWKGAHVREAWCSTQDSLAVWADNEQRRDKIAHWLLLTRRNKRNH